MKNQLQSRLTSWSVRLFVFMGVLIAGLAMQAQTTVDTNAPTVLTTVVAGNFNTAAAIGIGMAIVGLIVWAIYKGLLLKKR